MFTFTISMVTTLWSCSASHPQLYLIGYTSWVIACLQWRPVCLTKAKKDWSGPVCVEGKVADIVEVKNKHHHVNIYFYDAQFPNYTTENHSQQDFT